VVPTSSKGARPGVVFASLGTAGDLVYTFNTSTGALISSQQVSLLNATVETTH